MIKNLKIYGERCSGTNLLQGMCVGSSELQNDRKIFLKVKSSPLTGNTIPVIPKPPEFDGAFDLKLFYGKEYYGWKHWFGWYSQDIIHDGADTLFLCIARDPYDWINSFYNNKHHVPKENFPLEKFLLCEWYSTITAPNSPDYGEELLLDRNWKTGKRYQNIFELRKNKLEYLFDVMSKIAQNYEFIRFEELCTDHNKILNRIAKKYGLHLNENYFKPIPQEHYDLDEEMLKIINDNIDWDMEQKVGYSKRY